MTTDAIKRRLAALTADLHAARSEIAILDEQIAHFSDAAEDTRLRAMVSETPLADREHREASKTVNGLTRDRQKWEERVTSLETRQDQLLDELMEAGR
jgi:cell division septum initiation protein DivIVA